MKKKAMTYVESEDTKEEVDEEVDEVNDMEVNKKASIRPMAGLRRGSVFSKTFDPEDENETPNDTNHERTSDDEDEDYEIIQNKAFESQSKIKTNVQKEKLYQMISSIIIFKHLYDEDIYNIIDSMFERKCTQDEEIIREGDNGNYFYVIYNGSYEAYIKGKKVNDNNNNDIHTDGKYGRKVREYKDNGYFGELALLYDQVIRLNKLKIFLKQ